MNYAVFEQCHCTPDRLPFVTGFRVGMPSLARTSCTHAKTLRSPAARCIANDQFDTPVRAVRRRDLAALIKMLDQLHEAARCDRALTEACEIGFLDGVKLLYSRASSFWAGGHAFLLAVKNGHTRVALFLLRTTLPDVVRRCSRGSALALSWGHIGTAKALVRFALSRKPDDEGAFIGLLSVTSRTGDARLSQAILDRALVPNAAYAMRAALLTGRWECAAVTWRYLNDQGKAYIERYYGREMAQMEAWLARSLLLQSTPPCDPKEPFTCRV
ncbi:hypothetical protein ACF8O9_07560 [Stenotrophomonas geniculata]|uniref:hypothetical protein n=1 Tax=Stenotrophomonas geniculata TaxID=86188 RepID=UPI00370AAB92